MKHDHPPLPATGLGDGVSGGSGGATSVAGSEGASSQRVAWSGRMDEGLNAEDGDVRWSTSLLSASSAHGSRSARITSALADQI